MSTSSLVDSALTTEIPTPCRPPETAQPPPPNLLPACSTVSTTSTADLPRTRRLPVGKPRPLSTARTPPSASRVTSLRSPCPAIAPSTVATVSVTAGGVRVAGPAQVHTRPLRTMPRPSRTATALALDCGTQTRHLGRPPANKRQKPPRRRRRRRKCGRPEVERPFTSQPGDRAGARGSPWQGPERALGCSASAQVSPITLWISQAVCGASAGRQQAHRRAVPYRVTGAIRSPSDRVPARSSVGVPRAAAVADGAEAPAPARCVGPTTTTRRTVPSPSSSLSRLTRLGARRRTWVAQAVESARTVSSASVYRSALVWAATSGPTMWSHRARAPATATSVVEPRSLTSRSMVLSSTCGSRSSGAAPERAARSPRDRRPPRPDRASPRRRPDPPGPWPGRAWPPRRAKRPRPGRGRCRWDSRTDRAGRRRCRRCRRRSPRLRAGNRTGPDRRRQLTRRISPPATSYQTPATASDILADGGGHQHLFGTGDQGGQPPASTGVELGEDVVEDEDGLTAVAAEQVDAASRNDSAIDQHRHGRISLGGELAQAQDQVVAVRPDQRDTAAQLLVTPVDERVGDLRGERVGRRRLAEVAAAAVRDPGIVLGRGDVRVRLGHERREQLDRGERAARSSPLSLARWESQASSVRSALADACAAVFSNVLRCRRTWSSPGYAEIEEYALPAAPRGTCAGRRPPPTRPRSRARTAWCEGPLDVTVAARRWTGRAAPGRSGAGGPRSRSAPAVCRDALTADDRALGAGAGPGERYGERGGRRGWRGVDGLDEVVLL